MIRLSFVERECFRQIFGAIGTTNQYFVEVGYDGLFDKEDIPQWHGLLIDKGPALDLSKKVKVIKEFVTAENINLILKTNDVPAQIDFFGIDIDGNDYHVLKALNATVPRVIITEYNASLGPDKSITIKYQSDFERHNPLTYHGASLTAFTKLLNSRDYALVAVEFYGVNAFFVKRELCVDKLRELTAAEAWRPHQMRGVDWQNQFNVLKDMEFEEV